MSHPFCENCRFWTSRRDLLDDPAPDALLEGECFRYPPVMLQARNDSGRFVWVWPQTNHHDWCGEFKPRMEEA